MTRLICPNLECINKSVVYRNPSSFAKGEPPKCKKCATVLTARIERVKREYAVKSNPKLAVN